VLPPNFYPKLRELTNQLNESIKQNPTHTTLSEQRQAFMKAKDLINCRLQKILRLSFERNPSKPLVEALQPEEKSLFNNIRSEIDDWREKILLEETK
jgi:DNA replication initiation complex subunit (GINS family)